MYTYRTILSTVLVIAFMMVSVACQPIATDGAPTAGSGDEAGAHATLVIASHDSFNMTAEVLEQFETEHNATLQFLELGDAGAALNKVILSKDAPLADIFFGVDNTFLSRALDADIFEAYASPMLDQVPDELELDPEHRLLPVDYGFVNLNADSEWFAEQGIPLPESLDDLINPEYSGLLVAPNPATSSPGLAFLLATIANFGEDGYVDYWRALRENDVLITSGWSEAYFEHFTVGSGGSGDRPLVVSYTTSPPADIVFATDGRTEPASVNINPPGGAFRQIEFVGILQGTEQRELAEAFIDFMLSEAFQQEIPLQMYVYPVNENAELPPVFVEFGQVPAEPAVLPPEAIEENREAWTEAWTEVVLR